MSPTIVKLAPVITILLHAPCLAGTESKAATGVDSVYALVAKFAVGALPPNLRPYFERDLETLCATAVSWNSAEEAGPNKLSPTRPSEIVRCHFVRLDAAAAGKPAGDPRACVQAFPRDEQSAQRLFLRAGVDGGRLLWALSEQRDALRTALKHADRKAAIREAARLVHLATDAAFPWNVSVREAPDQKEHPPPGASRAGEGNHGWYARFTQVLFPGSAERLHLEVRIAPSRVNLEPVPADEIFEALQNTFDTWVLLDAIDEIADAATPAPRTNDDPSPAEINRYHHRLMELAGPIFETRLENAAVLAARLIVDAWLRAGKPVLRLEDPATAARPAEDIDTQTRVRWVASRNGSVFHLSTCSHARRIRPDNRLTFVSPAEALGTGRSPCRSCKPVDP